MTNKDYANQAKDDLFPTFLLTLIVQCESNLKALIYSLWELLCELTPLLHLQPRHTVNDVRN